MRKTPKTGNCLNTASRIIRERIISSDDFAHAYEIVCKYVTEKIQGADAQKMKELGGFSQIISDAIENLPPNYHENRGSKMLHDSVACVLRGYTQDIRIEAQRRNR